MFTPWTQRLLLCKQFRASLNRKTFFNHATKILSSDAHGLIPSDKNFVDFVWDGHKKFENKIALTCGITGRSLTFGGTFDAFDRLSVNLPAEVGLQSGDSIALILPNVPEFPIAFFAAASAGIVASLINPMYTPDELSKLFDNCKPKAVVTIPSVLSNVREAMDKMHGGGVPVVLVGGDGSQKDTLDFQALCTKSTKGARRLEKPDPESTIAMPFSSGTTGVPKGVVISHRNMVAECACLHLDGVPNFESEQNSTVAVIPFFHIYGTGVFMGFSFYRGIQLVTLPKFEPSTFANAIKTYMPSYLFLVPPLIQHVARSPQITPDMLNNLKFVGSGAAPITGQIVEEFLFKTKHAKTILSNGYGMTETTGMITTTPDSIQYGEYGIPVGKLTIQAEAKVVGENEESLSLGEVGELWLRGPLIMKGYLNNEKATNESITADGWLKSGDQARIGKDGTIYIVDRLKDVIKVKGFQVSPTEIEDVLIKMPGLADVAVVGVPVEDGEGPKAFIVKAAGSDITAEDVHKFLEPKVAKFKKLSGGVQFIEQIPRSAAGKILKKDLIR